METKKSMTITESQMRAWCKSVLDTTTMPEADKEIIADVLVTTVLRGVDTHGLNLLRPYVERYQKYPPRAVRIEKDNRASILLDGGDNLGPVVAAQAMEIAMERAAEYGIGFVLACNSSHFGAAAYYTCMAAERGFVGFCSSTSRVDLAPWGGGDAVVGKNPFSISMPGDEFPIVLDVACSVTARQKVVMHAREGKPIPQGWALDRDGNPTTDPEAALEGIFLPFGGYKGIGIAVMLELLMAGLCRRGYSKDVTLNEVMTGPQNISHVFMAVDTGKYLTRDELAGETSGFSRFFHGGRKLPGTEKLYLPGELEWDTSLERRKNGAPVSPGLLAELDAYSADLGIPSIAEF